MTVSLSPSFQLTISQNFTSSHFRNLTKTVVCSYIRAVSDTMQDTENCSWTLCRSLQAGICHVIGEVQPCFRAKVRNYMAALGFACLHVEFVCIWQPVLSIQQNLLTSVSEATHMLRRSCSAGGPNFLAHHYKKPIFVSKGRGWVGLLLIMLVDWKQN